MDALAKPFAVLAEKMSDDRAFVIFVFAGIVGTLFFFTKHLVIPILDRRAAAQKNVFELIETTRKEAEAARIETAKCRQDAINLRRDCERAKEAAGNLKTMYEAIRSELDFYVMKVEIAKGLALEAWAETKDEKAKKTLLQLNNELNRQKH